MFQLPGQRAFKRLIPVAQTQVYADIAVTVTSLDCYEHGFDIHMYVWRDADDGLTPHFCINALFDGKHPVPSGGGLPRENGTHHPRDPHWYFSCRRNPSPFPSVREVQLFIPVIHLTEARPHETMRLVRDVPGPWIFSAATSTAKAAENTKPIPIPFEELDRAWANPERVQSLREKRQQRTMPKYGSVYDLVLNTLYRYDPWGVGWKTDWPFGAEEYNLEAGMIVDRLSDARSVNDVRRIVHEIMRDYYGRTMGGEERYIEIAEEIWRECQQVQ